jgi:hypothetical protein
LHTLAHESIYRVYHLKHNKQQSRTSCKHGIRNGSTPVERTLPTSPVTLESRSPWLLGRRSRQLRNSCAGASMVYSRAERVFILEHYCASKSVADFREAFSNAYPDREVTNKTTKHRLVTTFWDTWSVCLWQVLIERRNSWILRPYRFQAVHQLQQRDTAARIHCYQVSLFCACVRACVCV